MPPRGRKAEPEQAGWPDIIKDGTISAKRAATDDLIYIQIRTPDGLFPSRMLQIRWAKISEYPRHAEQFQ